MIVAIQVIFSFISIDYASILLVDTVLTFRVSDIGLSLADSLSAANTDRALIRAMAVVKGDSLVQMICFFYQ